MASKSFTLTLGFLAALSFAALPGCEDSSTTTVTEATGEDGHGHDEDSHEHGEDGHGHEDGDHAHGDEHGDEHGEDHDHDFETLAAALEEIVELRDTIRDEFAAGDADAAHDPLHHIGEVLVATENMIKEMDDSETKTAVAAAVESLLDDFTAVDQGMHVSDESENKGKKYEDVSKSIDEAIETLKKGAE